MPVSRRREHWNSQRACGWSPADETQQSEYALLCALLILLDPFFLFRLKDYWIKGNDWSSEHVVVSRPHQDVGLIFWTHWPNLRCEGTLCVLGQGTRPAFDWLQNGSACSWLCYWQHFPTALSKSTKGWCDWQKKKKKSEILAENPKRASDTTWRPGDVRQEVLKAT